MKREITVVVENGHIQVPENVGLTDGARVRVVWDDDPPTPTDGAPWTKAELQADLDWAQAQEPGA